MSATPLADFRALTRQLLEDSASTKADTTTSTQSSSPTTTADTTALATTVSPSSVGLQCESFCCSECEKDFPSISDLSNHMTKSHNKYNNWIEFVSKDLTPIDLSSLFPNQSVLDIPFNEIVPLNFSTTLKNFHEFREVSQGKLVLFGLNNFFCKGGEILKFPTSGAKETDSKSTSTSSSEPTYLELINDIIPLVSFGTLYKPEKIFQKINTYFL